MIRLHTAPVTEKLTLDPHCRHPTTWTHLLLILGNTLPPSQHEPWAYARSTFPRHEELPCKPQSHTINSTRLLAGQAAWKAHCRSGRPCSPHSSRSKSKAGGPGYGRVHKSSACWQSQCLYLKQSCGESSYLGRDNRSSLVPA